MVGWLSGHGLHLIYFWVLRASNFVSPRGCFWLLDRDGPRWFEFGQFSQMTSCSISQFVVVITTLTPLLLMMSTDNLI